MADLKKRLDLFIITQERALEGLEASYRVEKRRLEAQITYAKAAVEKWDDKADELLDALAKAGIRVKVE